ncbi:MAG: prolipoprotein diacylglyceryl transferase [Bdellovibrionota bacterium]
MVHDLSPFAIHFFDNFGIRWYGLSYMFGFFAAYLIMRWLCEKQKAGLNADMVSDLITYIAIGTLAGGRLGYCLFYSPDLFLKFKPNFPWWGVLAVNEGGMASHGGIIGIVLAIWLFSRKYKVNTLYLFDLAALTGPIGICAGRLANFINGELVGRPAPSDLPWAVRFPQDIFLWPKNEPGRLPSLAPVVEKMDITSNQWLEWIDQIRNADGAAREKIYSVLNLIVEKIQSGNIEIKNTIGPLLTPRHPSQLYGAFGEGLLIFTVLFLLWRTPKKPGFIASSFIVLYALVRISDEYFRMPDDHLGLQWLDLSRGQWLSIFMLTLGLFLMFIWSRSVSITVPGWGKLQSIKLSRK